MTTACVLIVLGLSTILPASAGGGDGGSSVLPAGLRINFLGGHGNQVVPALRLQAVSFGRLPDFSWHLIPAIRGSRDEVQTAYQIQASASPGFGVNSLLCDTGRVASNQTGCVRQCNVSSATRGSPVYWRVRAAGRNGALSPWVAGPTIIHGPELAGLFVAAPNTTVPGTNAPVRLRTSVNRRACTRLFTLISGQHSTPITGIILLRFFHTRLQPAQACIRACSHIDLPSPLRSPGSSSPAFPHPPSTRTGHFGCPRTRS